MVRTDASSPLFTVGGEGGGQILEEALLSGGQALPMSHTPVTNR